MSLSVPPVGDTSSIVSPYRGAYHPVTFYPQAPPTIDDGTTPVHGDSYKVRYDAVRQEIVLEQDKICPIHRGDWIVLTSTTTATNGKPQVTINFPKPQSHASYCVCYKMLATR
jgi:hypothetical protein